MEVDLGSNRGKLRFTWKELTATVSLAGAMCYHVIETRVELAQTKKTIEQVSQREEKCEKKIAELESTLFNYRRLFATFAYR